MLGQTHTHNSFRKFYCAWSREVILSQAQKAEALVNQLFYTLKAEVSILL